MTSPVEDATRQAARRAAAVLRALVELTGVLENVRRPAAGTSPAPGLTGSGPDQRYAMAFDRETILLRPVDRASALHAAGIDRHEDERLASGCPQEQAERVPAAMERYGIMRTPGESGTHPIQVDSVERANRRIAVGVAPDMRAHAATSGSTTMAAPPSGRREQPVAAATVSQAPNRSTGRSR